MKHRRAYIITVTAAALALVLVQPTVQFLSGLEALHGHVEPLEAAEAEVEQLYTCSMHPFIIRSEPGSCPICGMTLVPVRGTAARKEDEEGDGGIITIDPSTQQNMGVRFDTVQRRDMSRTVRTVGLVGYEESRQYSVNAKIDGWIERLHVNQTGEAVRKGQALLDIYSPDLVTAQEEFLLAVRNNATLQNSPFPEIAAGAANLLAASRKRLQYWDISDKQIETLEQTGEIRKTLTLYAIQNGVVTRKNVNEGAFVKAGAELYQLSDISRVWIYADIYEYELPWVKEGQVAEIQFPYPRPPVTGRVKTIYPYVESRTRTVKARIDVDNADLALKPDMFVNVNITGHSARAALAVPSEAVLRSGLQETVFVSLGDGRFDPRRIQTGLETDDGYIQVLEGLHEGERIVTSAQFMFDSESRLREAIGKMKPSPAEADAEPATPSAAPAGTSQQDLDNLFK